MRFQKVRNPACLLSFSQRTCFMVLFLVFGSGRRKQEIQVTFISLSFWISICFPFLPSTSLSFLFFSLRPISSFTRPNKEKDKKENVNRAERFLLFIFLSQFLLREYVNGFELPRLKEANILVTIRN